MEQSPDDATIPGQQDRMRAGRLALVVGVLIFAAKLAAFPDKGRTEPKHQLRCQFFGFDRARYAKIAAHKDSQSVAARRRAVTGSGHHRYAGYGGPVDRDSHG